MAHARLAVAVAVLAAVASSRASAGVLIEAVNPRAKDEGMSRFLLEGQKVRLESKNGETMIFDGAAQKAIQLDPRRKSYMEMTAEDMAQVRAMMEERTGAKPAQTKVHARRYEKTGRTDTALGKSCDVYRVVDEEGADKGDEFCAAPFGAFGVSSSDFDGFRAFGKFASQLAGGRVDRSWADLPGIPLIGWSTHGGKREETFRATKVEKRGIPDSEFTAPAGWTKAPGIGEQMQQMEQMKALRKGGAGK